ncbi:MAG: M20/M25/M40 family metallo-hydrolase, partial [Actinobacteria bacterium]|nr:M20/M25/M40 family metallo-hydrolase [Actinomycetota bacterium]
PTKIQSDQPCTNVVPSEIRLWLDWRSVPGEERDDLLNKLNAILSECLVEGVRGEVAVAKVTGKYYTCKEVSQEACMPCFKIDARHPLVRTAQKALSKALGERIEPSVVTYASDASILAAHGVPTLIFGPGEPSMAHVSDERIELAQMRQAAKGYLRLLAELGG